MDRVVQAGFLQHVLQVLGAQLGQQVQAHVLGDQVVSVGPELRTEAAQEAGQLLSSTATGGEERGFYQWKRLGSPQPAERGWISKNLP